MEDPKVIYLGPACQKEGDGREWCEDDAWTQCECGCSSVRYMLESDAQSELAALREELARNTAYWDGTADMILQLRKSLADAERQNGEHISMLKHFANLADVRNVGTHAMDYVSALNPNPEAASHDE